MNSAGCTNWREMERKLGSNEKRLSRRARPNWVVRLTWMESGSGMGSFLKSSAVFAEGFQGSTIETDGNKQVIGFSEAETRRPAELVTKTETKTCFEENLFDFESLGEASACEAHCGAVAAKKDGEKEVNQDQSEMLVGLNIIRSRAFGAKSHVPDNLFDVTDSREVLYRGVMTRESQAIKIVQNDVTRTPRIQKFSSAPYANLLSVVAKRVSEVPGNVPIDSQISTMLPSVAPKFNRVGRALPSDSRFDQSFRNTSVCKCIAHDTAAMDMISMACSTVPYDQHLEIIQAEGIAHGNIEPIFSLV
ncbi:hypothetical protein C8R45DRAFT_925381 [Mycena sanguinolenta]|nr:hypothetical protein C8R45DRAFT_925381 [Mycena sanguinolenta]